MSQFLFERLLSASGQRGVQVVEQDQARFIKRHSPEDATLMAEAEIRSQIISRTQKLVRLTWEGETYLVAFGFNEPDVLPVGIDCAQLTPGIFAASIYAADIYPSLLVSGAQIKDAVELDHGGVAGYQGHDLSVIQPLFPACLTFRVASQERYLQSDYRVLGAIAARSYAGGPLHIDPQTLLQLAYLFESGSEFLPYRNILQGLLSFSWESLFLETYRCLEQLYARPRVSDLTSIWPSTLPLQEVVKLLELHLSWRPKEDEALMGLIKSCDGNSIQKVCLAFGVTFNSSDMDKSSEASASRIYKLRNNVVHYRPVHEVVQKPDDEWNRIIQAMLLVIDDIYAKYGSAFFVVKQS